MQAAYKPISIVIFLVFKTYLKLKLVEIILDASIKGRFG